MVSRRSSTVAARAYWKGYLKLSLVSCPIALFPATSEREKISFHQLNKETGNRIRYKKVDAETGRVDRPQHRTNARMCGRSLDARAVNPAPPPAAYRNSPGLLEKPSPISRTVTSDFSRLLQSGIFGRGAGRKLIYC